MTPLFLSERGRLVLANSKSTHTQTRALCMICDLTVCLPHPTSQYAQHTLLLSGEFQEETAVLDLRAH